MPSPVWSPKWGLNSGPEPGRPHRASRVPPEELPSRTSQNLERAALPSGKGSRGGVSMCTQVAPRELRSWRLRGRRRRFSLPAVAVGTASRAVACVVPVWSRAPLPRGGPGRSLARACGPRPCVAPARHLRAPGGPAPWRAVPSRVPTPRPLGRCSRAERGSTDPVGGSCAAPSLVPGLPRGARPHMVALGSGLQQGAPALSERGILLLPFSKFLS